MSVRCEYIPLQFTVNPYYEDETIRPSDVPRQQRSYQEQPGVNRSRLARTTSMASSASYHSEDEDPDEVIEQEVLASSLKDPHSVLDLLPSRQLGTTLAAAHTSETWLRKRKSTRSTMSIKRGRGDSSTTVAVQRIATNDDMTGTSAMAEVRRRNTIKSIPGSIETKRRVRDKVQKRNKKKDKSVGCFTLILYNIGMGWQRFKNRVKSFIYSIDLWGGHIKKIEGNFGSGVTSYFTFLRWLLVLNLPVFLLSLSFVTIPQLVYIPSPTVNTASFSGWDLLTGMGWFTETELYYGYYTNETFSAIPNHYYNMPLAYLFTCGGYSLLLLAVVLYSMSKAYREYYIVGRGGFNYYITKVFCSWDYNVTAKKSAKLKHKSIYLELAEQLSSQHEKKKYTKCQTLGIWLGRLCTNLIALALIAGACAGVIVGYQKNINERLEDQTVSVLIMPLIICGLNLFLPPVFSFISNYERYRSPRVKLYITMARTILLKASLLVVLIHFWLERSSCGQANLLDEFDFDDDDDVTTAAPDALTTASLSTVFGNSSSSPISEECTLQRCWETEFGQELYRLVVIDFIFLLLTAFFVEFLRRIFSDYCCKSWSRPDFDIARNTMELIHAQALTWLGMFFSPLLIFICILKLVILFYVKRFSVIANCSPSLKPWRAGRTTTVFIGMLLLMFFITAGSVLYSIVRISPSATCGPFRHLQTMYDVVFILLEDWASSETLNWIYGVISFIASPGFILLFILILCLGVYYYKAIAKGSREQMKKLRYQISVEGKDKMFLLKMLQDKVKMLPRDQQLHFTASLTRGQHVVEDHSNGLAVHAADVHAGIEDVRDGQASATDIEAWIEDEAANGKQS
ncbi:transmembrane channel-like protein 6 isoform X2 [Ptychodera flava]|uniref:transmembrane channel-like protein 6 isoform X2 n=1 Tax=Ptychodera flava TaxID=63121 RepID=UPI00396A0FA1